MTFIALPVGHLRRICLPLLALLFIPSLAAAPATDAAPVRFASAMERFAQQDETLEPNPDRVVFIGSSSIRGWPLEDNFPDLDTLNRGFGGSEISDSIAHFERLVLTHRPSVIVFYAGDNDVAAGKSAHQVYTDYRTFVGMVHDALPETTVIFVAIKPSIARWSKWEEMRVANAFIQGYSDAHDRLEYVDIAGPSIDEETGEPRPELLISDGLHLTREGYDLWTSLVRPLIDEALAD